MVAKLIALYKNPKDPKAFDAKFHNDYIPLVQKVPGLQLIELSQVNGAPSGEAAFYLMTEFYFDNMEAVKAGLASPEGQAARDKLMSFAGDLVTLLFAEVNDKN